jgi:hypothetical protein
MPCMNLSDHMHPQSNHPPAMDICNRRGHSIRQLVQAALPQHSSRCVCGCMQSAVLTCAPEAGAPSTSYIIAPALSFKVCRLVKVSSKHPSSTRQQEAATKQGAGKLPWG